MNKICIVFPYFGKLPNNFDYWYYSALNNPTVDFMFFTDCDVPISDNIFVFKISFGFSISLFTPYKLCDFRGAYGDIFCNELEGYDFWGFGDTDLIYGNIREFFTEQILNHFDLISGWGHLTLYRNIDACNLFYKNKIEGYLYYKDVFVTPQNMGFDEYGHMGLSDMWINLYPDKVWSENVFDDLLIPEISWNFRSYRKENMGNLIFIYEKGTLYRISVKNGEICRCSTLYVHLHRRPFLTKMNDNFDNYFIVPNRFINLKELTINSVIILSIDRSLYYYQFMLMQRWKTFLYKISPISYGADISWWMKHHGFISLLKNKLKMKMNRL